MSELELG